MKKMTSASAKALYLLAMLLVIIITSCNPDPNDILPDPKPQPPAPKAPTIVSVTSDTPTYNAKAHLKVVMTDGDSVFANGAYMENPLAFTTGNLTTNTKFTILVKGKGGSVSQDYTVPVWTERRTIWCHALIKYTKFMVCDEDSIAYPSAWHDISSTIDIQLTKFNLDGSGYVVSNGSQIPFSGKWSFKNGETVFNDGPNDWTIDSVTAQKVVYHRIAADPYNPAVHFRTMAEGTFQ